MRTTSRIPDARRAQAGSALIIIMWVTLGLVSVALYFGHSMTLTARSADNRLADYQATQAVEAGSRYVGYVLANSEYIGELPYEDSYLNEAVQVGDGQFWILGRNPEGTYDRMPYYGLVDEASKLNLHIATEEMLEQLPGMTPELAAAIVEWRTTYESLTNNDMAQYYESRTPAYIEKNGRFESLEELNLLYGADYQTLYGEDANLNGTLDPNEDDADQTLPYDNHDGNLEPGILEYVTIYSREPNLRADGSARINILDQNSRSNLTQYLSTTFGQDRVMPMLQVLSNSTPPTSVLDFYFKANLQSTELDEVMTNLTVITGQYIEGLVNVNTASATVLACLPGMDIDKANTMVASRQQNNGSSTGGSTSLAWLASAVDAATATQIGPYITGSSYIFSADIVGVGHHGRGYRRTKFVYDTSGMVTNAYPVIVDRKDLDTLGWSLGEEWYATLREDNQEPR